MCTHVMNSPPLPPANFTHYQITLSELIFGMTEPTAVLTCSYRSHLKNIKSNCQFVP